MNALHTTETEAAVKTPVYVFSSRWADDATLSSDLRQDVIYRAVKNDRVRYQGRAYDVRRKLMGCGVFAVPVIFVEAR